MGSGATMGAGVVSWTGSGVGAGWTEGLGPMADITETMLATTGGAAPGP